MSHSQTDPTRLVVAIGNTHLRVAACRSEISSAAPGTTR